MNFNDNQAIYLQIVELMCENILLKKWPENEKIPSVRQLAMEVEVNHNTAMRTYAFLQEKEIIYNKRGIGFFVAENGYSKTLEFMKAKFIEHDVPIFLKMLKLLNMELKDIETQNQ
jgi:DNA-binding transcriptional regulator YhcF (GntR family)